MLALPLACLCRLAAGCMLRWVLMYSSDLLACPEAATLLELPEHSKALN